MLVLRRENDETAICSLDASRITVGRDASNDVVLDDASVSGFHAVLFCEDGSYAVADLGSTNGTFINKRPVSGRAAFSEGDTLRFGTRSLDVGDGLPRRRATVVMPAVQLKAERSGKSSAMLRLISGNGQPEMVSVGASLSVGRAADNNLILDSDMVSGRHAAITLNNGGAELVDIGSTNGTYVNGERVSRRALQHGDCIRFDTIEYLFEMPENDLRATRVNPAIQAEMVLAKVDALTQEISTKEKLHQISKVEPILSSTSVTAESPIAPNAASAKTIVQPALPPLGSDADSEVPLFLRDEEPDPHRYRDDLGNKTEEEMSPLRSQSGDDGIGTMFRMAFSVYVDWLPAIALIACGIVLQTWFSYKAIGSRSVLDGVLAMTSSLAPLAGFSVLLAASAKKLGYGIESALNYGLMRFFPLLGAGLGFSLVLVVPILVFAVIGAVGASVAGSQSAGMLLMIPGYFVSIYLLLRLWPMMVMAITDRDALAMRPAWRLTGQSGAFMAATGPIFGWWLLLMVVTMPLSIFGGIPGYVIASIVSIFLIMPVLGLLVVSRYMRLHTLPQAAMSGR